ncbi:MAG: tRNA (guanosine(37)-N1)-methyltransferase TrmD [Bacteroidia bacterium]|nr:tRNA (guanosine(37)-N1)-methyltransferase TrmD [Bacteroidia bacterium]MDW8236639.1 tRNA (guanosine(37)-N1)-methyltransferase TrmD [Bacteroidia bacterium]
MHIDVLTAFPEFFVSPLATSMLKRALQKGLVCIQTHDLRAFAKDGQIDDYPYGGGAGMVIRIDVVVGALRHLQKQRDYNEIIYLTADGEPLTQRLLNRLSLQHALLLIAGHYKGIDDRIRHYVTREVSIGDYVLTGGEIPALVLIDGIVRLLPGVLSDESSALEDSFQDDLLAPPVYTRPAEFEGLRVPDVLLSGNHQAIAQWRLEMSLQRTQERRPYLIRAGDATPPPLKPDAASASPPSKIAPTSGEEAPS